MHQRCQRYVDERSIPTACILARHPLRAGGGSRVDTRQEEGSRQVCTKVLGGANRSLSGAREWGLNISASSLMSTRLLWSPSRLFFLPLSPCQLVLATRASCVAPSVVCFEKNAFSHRVWYVVQGRRRGDWLTCACAASDRLTCERHARG